MKYKLVIVALIVLSAICLYLSFKISRVNQKLTQIESVLKADSNATKDPAPDEEFELAPYMGRLQIYANKLWFAGNHANWELAGFYVHEIEEAFEEIQKHKIIENGVDVSVAVKDWGLGPIGKMEEIIKKSDKVQFITEYESLISNCNGCHVTTKHNFIKITIPETPAVTNQLY